METIEHLWRRYSQTRDRSVRDQLVLNYASLVKFVVGRLAIGLPPSLQQDDLIGFGTLGLIEAVDRFEPERGFKFETYAVTRIRGQIIDSLRSFDILPRSVHRQARQIEQAVADLSQALGRSPQAQEVADRLGLNEEQYHTWLRHANFAILSLDRPLTTSEGEQTTLYDSLEDNTLPAPTEQVDDMELKAELVEAITALPEREQLLISLYYNDELTMKEIGHILNVSESRVSQMHAKAMLTLRGLIRRRNEPNEVDDWRPVHASTYAPA